MRAADFDVLTPATRRYLARGDFSIHGHPSVMTYFLFSDVMVFAEASRGRRLSFLTTARPTVKAKRVMQLVGALLFFLGGGLFDFNFLIQ